MQSVTQTANRLIKQHGESAPNIAAERAADPKLPGGPEMRTFWINVIVEAKVLLARDFHC